MYDSVCDTALAVRICIAYESSRTLEYEIFTRTKISAIAVHVTCDKERRWKVETDLIRSNVHVSTPSPELRFLILLPTLQFFTTLKSYMQARFLLNTPSAVCPAKWQKYELRLIKLTSLRRVGQEWQSLRRLERENFLDFFSWQMRLRIRGYRNHRVY